MGQNSIFIPFCKRARHVYIMRWFPHLNGPFFPLKCSVSPQQFPKIRYNVHHYREAFSLILTPTKTYIQ